MIQGRRGEQAGGDKGPLTVAAHRALTDVDREAWDATLPSRSLYASTPWLAHAEATGDAPAVYVMAHRGDTLVGSLVGYPLPADTPYVFSGPAHPVDALHRSVHGEPAPWLAELAPALACGGRNPAHSTIGTGTGTGTRDRERRAAVAATLLGHAEDVARSEGLACLALPAVAVDDEVLRAACSVQDFIALPAQDTYSLPLGGLRSLEDYLAAFQQRRRVKIKREIRALAEAGVQYETHALDEALIEQIAPLEVALYARHGGAPDPAAFRSVLVSVALRVPSARVTLASVAGRLAGFVLTFEYRGEIYARQAGFDYDVQGDLPIYFGLVYYQLVAQAAADGRTTIHYSTGSDRVKLSRGCEALQQIAYVKPLSRGLRQRLVDLAAMCTEVPTRTEVPTGTEGSSQVTV